MLCVLAGYTPPPRGIEGRVLASKKGRGLHERERTYSASSCTHSYDRQEHWPSFSYSPWSSGGKGSRFQEMLLVRARQSPSRIRLPTCKGHFRPRVNPHPRHGCLLPLEETSDNNSTRQQKPLGSEQAGPSRTNIDNQGRARSSPIQTPVSFILHWVFPYNTPHRTSLKHGLRYTPR